MVSVYLFVPNLIGYFRVVSAIAAFAVAHDQPLLCLGLYTLSFVLDAADGHAARLLNQCSSFGAILDMMTDRAATAAFLVLLSDVLQLGRWGVFTIAMLVGLDVASHFVRMYASLFLKHASHKDMSPDTPWLLRVYYTNRRVMASFCIGQEFSYLALYTLHFYPQLQWLALLNNFVLLPLCFLKQVCNVLQLLDGFREIAEEDTRVIASKKK